MVPFDLQVIKTRKMPPSILHTVAYLDYSGSGIKINYITANKPPIKYYNEPCKLIKPSHWSPLEFKPLRRPLVIYYTNT